MTLWSRWWWASCTSLCSTTVTTRLSPCLQTTTLTMSSCWMTVSCGHQLLPDSQEADTGSPDCVGVQRRQSVQGLHQHSPAVRTVLLHDIPRSGDCCVQCKQGMGTGCLSMMGRPSGDFHQPVEYFVCQCSVWDF